MYTGSREISLFEKTFEIFVNYSVGDTGPAGGVVFYDKGSFSNGWRYLESAPASTEWISNIWGGYKTSVKETGTSIGIGKLNTDKIIVKYGNYKLYGKDTDYAAKLCSYLVHGGFRDWFLPSKDELNLMYINLYKKGLGGFSSDYYWSSSETTPSYAWAQNFVGGRQSSSYKGNVSSVRAVRTF